MTLYVQVHKRQRKVNEEMKRAEADVGRMQYMSEERERGAK
jgi:hypothetical protein